MSYNLKDKSLWMFKFPHDFDTSAFAKLKLDIADEPAAAGEIVATFSVNNCNFALIENSPSDYQQVINLFPVEDTDNDSDDEGETALKLGKPFSRSFTVIRVLSQPGLAIATPPVDILTPFPQPKFNYLQALQFAANHSSLLPQTSSSSSASSSSSSTPAATEGKKEESSTKKKKKSSKKRKVEGSADSEKKKKKRKKKE